LGTLAESIEVKVTEDKVHGSSAIIRIKAAPNISEADIKSKVREVLGSYTIKYYLEVG
jgi:fatty-acyl-CoA synthase